MRCKPILLWPNARSDIAAVLDREPDDFVVVDTNSPHELQRLYPLKNNTPIFDPFPGRGQRYREFKEHIGANSSRHIAGLDLCRQVLQALNEPSLARASIDELCNALATPGRVADQPKWSLGSALSGLATALVFPVTLVGNWLFPQNTLLASLAATACFGGTYLGVRLVMRSWPGSASLLRWSVGRTSVRSAFRSGLHLADVTVDKG